jgi:hypothetical protein
LKENIKNMKKNWKCSRGRKKQLDFNHSGKIIIRDSPTIANIGKKTVKSHRFVHEIFRNAFPPKNDSLLVNILPLYRTFCQE